jgi:hypothetical protein
MAAREPKKHDTEEKAVRKLTAAELTAAKKYLARLEAKPSGRFKVSKHGSNLQIGFDHPHQLVGRALVMDALASADEDFLNGIMNQLANASAHGQDIDERGLNFMLSVIKGIEPRDQLEAMLAAQMAAVHVATMTFACKQAPVNVSAFNKLIRTFVMQMEALKRYRAAEQKVTLQHVSVTEGGQAIIGNVTHAPRKSGQEKAAQEKAGTPPPTLPDTNVVPMPIMGKSKEHEPLSVRRKSNK